MKAAHRLIAAWERQAKLRLKAADAQSCETDRKAIGHTAIVLLNCANELKAALAECRPLPSTNPSGDIKLSNSDQPLGRGCSDGLGAWVPTGERLPSHNATVLVWRAGVFDRLTPGSTQITTFRLTGDGPQWNSDQHHWPLPPSLVCRVTHWMPLPAPPVSA